MMRFADVAVSVSDAKAAVAFWTEKVGFRTANVPGNEHAVLVAPPGDRFVLHLCEGYERVEPGNTGVAFLTDDLEADVARLRARGVEFEPRAKEGHEAGMAKFRDPDGNVFWLIGAPAPAVEALTSMRAPE
ncbi:MAG TPA: VOC family protein [Candidatus Thermoplasmatota archaeon]|nr:VOC family protein [Candidatus Thermoplasmatota archaeon]